MLHSHDIFYDIGLRLLITQPPDCFYLYQLCQPLQSDRLHKPYKSPSFSPIHECLYNDISVLHVFVSFSSCRMCSVDLLWTLQLDEYFELVPWPFVLTTNAINQQKSQQPEIKRKVAFIEDAFHIEDMLITLSNARLYIWISLLDTLIGENINEFLFSCGSTYLYLIIRAVQKLTFRNCIWNCEPKAPNIVQS